MEPSKEKWNVEMSNKSNLPFSDKNLNKAIEYFPLKNVTESII